VIAAAVLAIQLTLVPVEVCVQSPDPPADDWHWRTVDGRKCWHRADRLLPREDLFWEYDAQELDAAEGVTVLDRKHYRPEDLRRRVESPDSSRAERKKRRWERRHRRHRDDDDDD
jgi:hypothetical protein